MAVPWWAGFVAGMWEKSCQPGVLLLDILLLQDSILPQDSLYLQEDLLIEDNILMHPHVHQVLGPDQGQEDTEEECQDPSHQEARGHCAKVWGWSSMLTSGRIIYDVVIWSAGILFRRRTQNVIVLSWFVEPGKLDFQLFLSRYANNLAVCDLLNSWHIDNLNSIASVIFYSYKGNYTQV